MDAAASVAAAATLQRANGELLVSVKRRGADTVLDDLRQSGCLKARFPRPATDGWVDVTILNTSGGIAGGDRLDVSVHVQPGARATITTPAAERFYRTLPDEPPAVIRNRLHVAAGASAEWLPQETLLFDRCALHRWLDVELADDAWFLGLETLVFGRAAMGEHVRQAWLRDAIRIRRGGRWLLHESVRLDAEVGLVLPRPAIAGGARALATLVHVAPDAEAALERVRSALVDSGVEAGASAWNRMLLVRILAGNAATLRRTVIGVLSVLRDSRPLPRMWLC
ncbi:MAG TPA: urease accessory protein UreD [Acetobacteraceae bacterium]|jgi:urease accessory protein|nr:urease accessory protein UreD [Acetobacteraceae bacterium]